MKKFIFTFLFVILAIPAMAQFELGVSYETRSEEPKNGFGAKLEIGILESLPLVNLGIRIHGSYFNEENKIAEGGVSYSKELTNYDVGVAAVGGISLGFAEPYVGLGIGTETLDYEKIAESEIASAAEVDDSDSALYFNTFVGAKVKILPIITPFVEYRFSNSDISMPDVNDTNGRFMLGVSLRF